MHRDIVTQLILRKLKGLGQCSWISKGLHVLCLRTLPHQANPEPAQKGEDRDHLSFATAHVFRRLRRL